jgi:hypothetical protein
MIKQIFILLLFISMNSFAKSYYVPSKYLADEQLMKSESLSVEFSEGIEYIVNTQSQTLENFVEQKSTQRFELAGMVTSFAVSNSGLLGLSAVSASSSTSMFWSRKNTVANSKSTVKSYYLTDIDNEQKLAEEVDDIASYLKENSLVKNPIKLTNNLHKAIKRGQNFYDQVANLEHQKWKINGFRLDLSISISGAVSPFVSVSGGTRLWLEWDKSSTAKTFKSRSRARKARKFVTKVLHEIDNATDDLRPRHFKLKKIYIGVGESLKTGFFGLANSSVGFVGYIRLARTKPMIKLIEDDLDKEITVTDLQETTKGIDKRAFSIPRRRLRQGIKKAIKYANFFINKAESLKSKKWEINKIRQISTISKKGFFGISNLTTKGVFIFIFEKENQKQAASFIPIVLTQKTTKNNPLSLVRLRFASDISIGIPWIADFKIKPNLAFIWK